MRKILPLLLALAVGLGSAGALSACGSKTVTDTNANGQTTVRTVKNIHFAKTKFLIHAGLAFGAFHRYIYKPFRAGSFRSGAPGRGKAIAKAGASALFIYHELKVAEEDAMSSDLLRRKLANPLAAALAKLKDLPSLIKGGSLGGVGEASGLLDKLKSAAGSAGASITDR